MKVRREFENRRRKDRTLPWIVDYRDAEGKRRHETFTTQKEAKDWVARTAVALQDGVHVPDRATVTIEQAGKLWITSCQAAGPERTTIDAYEGHLKYHINPAIGHVCFRR